MIAGMNMMHNGQEVLSAIDNYKIGSVLGEGSFGKVYHVNRITDNEEFALKVLKLWEVPKSNQPNILKRFELEYETGRIQCPYLVNTHEMGVVGNIPYFVMDYCPNSNLERKMNRGLNYTEIEKIGKSIILGLDALHQNGKIHRDLKPENILFDKEMQVRLSDFGISGHINHTLTQVNADNTPKQIFGSYAYMAPELLNPKKRIDTILPAGDIYAMGVILYEMFNNSMPFGSWNTLNDIQPYLERARKGEIIPMSDLVPDQWRNLIYKCLEPDVERRLRNMSEVKEFLGMQVDVKTPVHDGRGEICLLKVMQGERYGTTYTLKNKTQFLLGRKTLDSNNDIAIDETASSFISRKHATIEKIDNKYFIRDGQWCDRNKIWVLPKNGTYINGRKILTDSIIQLKDDDILIVGNTSLKFFTDSLTQINN